MYSEQVLNEFFNPQNVGVIKDASGVGKVGNPACGDIMKVYIMVEDDKIVDAKFQTFGCGSAVAASSILTEMIIAILFIVFSKKGKYITPLILEKK